MSMTGLKLPSFTRPNGKVYRPRKPPIAECTHDDDGEGILVVRTLDIDVAREVARRAWGRIETDFTVDEVKVATGWFRLVPWSDNWGDDSSTWIEDKAHGSPCVLFGAWAR
jgi:hypothetical protein